MKTSSSQNVSELMLKILPALGIQLALILILFCLFAVKWILHYLSVILKITITLFDKNKVIFKSVLKDISKLWKFCISVKVFIISPYQRNTIQTLLFKLFDKLIRYELVQGSQSLSSSNGLMMVLVQDLEEGGVNLTNFHRDLKPSVKVTLDLLKQGINCWNCCIYFIVPEN